MVKKISPVLTVFNVCLLVLALLASFSTVHASTDVKGNIALHTTWTKANSPYNLIGPIVVPQWTILTIEPGVTVNMNSYYIQVNGTLYARGNNSDPIHINGGGTSVDGNGNTIYPITFTPLSNYWNEQVGVGCIIENAILNSTSVFIASSPKICNNTFTNSYIQVSSKWFGSTTTGYSASPEISDNIISGVGPFGIQTFYTTGVISQNTISGFSSGIELVSSTSTIVQGNYITKNSDGIKLVVHQGPVTVQISENTITGNENGISLVRQLTAVNSATIRNNNIFSNLNYNINLAVPDNIDATNNWWGTTTPSVIDEMIKDHADDSALGTVTHTPFLTTPNPNAPAEPKEPEPTPEPTPTKLSISVDTTSTSVGSAVSVKGKLQNSSGSPLQNQRVTLSYSVDGENWNSIGSENTTESGVYTIQWTNTETGTFILKVDFAGNENYVATNATTSLSYLPHQETQKAFFIESNSTITLFTFNNKETELNFFAKGPSGTVGYVNATIPKDLLDSTEDWTVLVDNHKVTPTVIDDENNTYIYFVYDHNNLKTINIIGTIAIPEFSSVLCLLFILAGTLLVLLGKRRLIENQT